MQRSLPHKADQGLRQPQAPERPRGRNLLDDPGQHRQLVRRLDDDHQQHPHRHHDDAKKFQKRQRRRQQEQVCHEKIVAQPEKRKIASHAVYGQFVKGVTLLVLKFLFFGV